MLVVSRFLAARGAILVFLIAPAARAGDDEVAAAPRALPPPYVGEPAPKPAPLGHRGFQMALRSGLAIPMGRVKSSAGGDVMAPGARSSMGDLVGWQLPITLDIGGKPNRHLFVGGYLGVGLGQPTGSLGEVCVDTADCLATNVQLGAEVLYSFLPDRWVNPWLGYGFGYSWLTAGHAANKVELRGLELAHLLAGVDFRLTHTLGIGPYVDYSIGVYSHRSVAPDGGTLVNGDIRGRALHEWLVIGPRFVFFP